MNINLIVLIIELKFMIKICRLKIKKKINYFRTIIIIQIIKKFIIMCPNNMLSQLIVLKKIRSLQLFIILSLFKGLIKLYY